MFVIRAREKGGSEIKAKFDSLRAFLSSKKTLLIILVVAVMTLVISTMISIWLSKTDNLQIPSLGNLKTRGIEVYWDTNLENKTEKIDWGTIWIGASKNVTLYIRSISTIETTLKLDTSNWTFQDSDGKIVTSPSTNCMNLTWDYNETIVQPNETIQVTLTLSTVSSAEFINYLVTYDVRTFSFDIHIQTSEYE